ncbi:hypothetical protein SAICODRAFT_23844 [Saitoella complicata NRRL Y-17804]|nr:uncharacterized protein SAICODRAFT_23844 [Saitoella complicata NRRL Y-17804]ODQ55180.1 hypothetical protein SAICODRAFT_23844 [Saitoella complicata NRRL Y-17804]
MNAQATTTDRYVSSYPSLTPSEFEVACLHLQSQFLRGGVECTWHRPPPPRSPWYRSVVEEQPGYLSIRVYRNSATTSDPTADDDDDDDANLDVGVDEIELEDIDDPALAPPTHDHHQNGSNVTLPIVGYYHILLSPTYRLPILYFRFISPHPNPLTPILLSPDNQNQNQNQNQNADTIEIQGALSIAEHPLLGGTWWMIHPCMTGDAMMDVLDSDIDTGRVTAEEYMGLWMGVAGSVVGLGIPLPMARQ